MPYSDLDKKIHLHTKAVISVDWVIKWSVSCFNLIWLNDVLLLQNALWHDHWLIIHFASLHRRSPEASSKSASA